MESGIVGLKTSKGYLCQSIDTGEILELSEKELLKYKLCCDSVNIFEHDTGIIKWTHMNTLCLNEFIVDKNGTFIKFSILPDDVGMRFLKVDVLNGRRVEMQFGDEYHIREVSSARSISTNNMFLSAEASERLQDRYIYCSYAGIGSISHIKAISGRSSYHIELITKDDILTGLIFNSNFKMTKLE